MPNTNITTSLVRECFASLPVLVVWAVGLVIAIRRRREHPQVARMVMIACAVSLLTPLLMPLAMSVGYRINGAVFSPLLSFTQTCLAALSIGLLLYAAFLGRGERAMDAVEEPDMVAPTAPSGRLGTALIILAGIVRWTWRVGSIALTLFCGTFLVAGLSQGMHVSKDPGDLAMIAAGVIAFAGLVVAWRREGLGGLIILLTLLLLTGVGALINWHNGMKAGDMIAAGKDDLGPVVLPLLILLSWALHTLNDHTTAPRKRRLAVIVASVLAGAVAIHVWGMFPIHFNP